MVKEERPYFKPDTPCKKFIVNIFAVVLVVIVAILVNKSLNEKTDLSNIDKGAIIFGTGFGTALLLYFGLFKLIGYGK